MSIRFHLAQVNIGRFRAAIDDPIMDGFRTQLDPINAIADRSPGFVWRLQTEDGNATAIRPYADERMAINMSVWESLDAPQQYVYKSARRTASRPKGMVRADRWTDPRLVVDSSRPHPDRRRSAGPSRAPQGARPDAEGVHVQDAVCASRLGQRAAGPRRRVL